MGISTACSTYLTQKSGKSFFSFFGPKSHGHPSIVYIEYCLGSLSSLEYVSVQSTHAQQYIQTLEYNRLQNQSA